MEMNGIGLAEGEDDLRFPGLGEVRAELGCLLGSMSEGGYRGGNCEIRNVWKESRGCEPEVTVGTWIIH
jgi:hypothetical protein